MTTHQKLYMPVNDTDRKPEDGCCMKKVRLERTLKLRKEDMRDKDFNVLTNNVSPEENWLNTFGKDQKDVYLAPVSDSLSILHNEKSQIASCLSMDDLKNEKERINMNYMPKKVITHESSLRYQCIPKDNQLW